MSHKVKCRLCGHIFDTDAIEQDLWVMPSKNWYYHSRCYNDWKTSSNHTDEEWIELIYDFIARDLKQSYNYHMCEAQRKKFVKDGTCSNKGIYFALKYHYEIKKGDWAKSNGGIGIVPYIYKEACTYWVDLENSKRGTMAEIEKQIKARQAMPINVINRKNNKAKSKWNLDDI